MPEPMVHNPADCWKELHNGNPDALGRLYDVFADDLFHTACQITADRDLAKDCLHDVFVALWKYRSHVVSIAQPQAYLQKIIRNIACQKLKNAAQTIPLTYHVAQPAEPNAEEKFVQEDAERENALRLRSACSALTERQRTVIQLRFYEGLSYQQIAAKLRMNYQSVNNLVFRTLLNLRKEF